MKISRITRLYIIYILKYLIFLAFYPLVIIIDKIKKYRFIKFTEVKMDRISHVVYDVNGYIVAKKFSEELNNCKIIYFFGLYICNKQLKKMIKRVLPISNFSIFFLLLSKSFIFWKKNDHILNFSNFSIDTLAVNKKCKKFNYSKSNLYFSKDEEKKGSELIEQFGINEGDKWICIHNRDSLYLKKKYPYKDWSYHDYRDFSVNSLKSASEFFASKGYYVFRMGSLQSEKFDINNPKIIDYAFSNLKSDFLDIYLMSNAEFYFGSSSGLKGVAISFMKPCYGMNWSPTELYLDPGLYIDSNCPRHPWLFIFKRVKDMSTGKFLSLKEILSSDFAKAYSTYTFKKNNVKLVNNTSDEIRSLAIEINREINGEKIEEEDDKKIQDEFWKIFFAYSKIEKYGTIQPRISPSFLRHNLDLLN